jgi:TolB-like protein
MTEAARSCFSASRLPSAASYVFRGTVRRSGGRIRVTAQLGDVHTGVGLWAERFD